MQVKKITAKIRDMVKISLMENGDERIWYNNIELPDEIKALEMKDFHFNTLVDGKIEFQIHFELGVLPKVLPEKKARWHRTAKTIQEENSPRAPVSEPKSVASDQYKITELKATSKPTSQKPKKKAITPTVVCQY